MLAHTHIKIYIVILSLPAVSLVNGQKQVNYKRIFFVRPAISSDGGFTPNVMRHSLMSSMLTDLNNFVENLLTAKSSAFKSVTVGKFYLVYVKRVIAPCRIGLNSTHDAEPQCDERVDVVTAAAADNNNIDNESDVFFHLIHSMQASNALLVRSPQSFSDASGSPSSLSSW
jgi:hypothetical protein